VVNSHIEFRQYLREQLLAHADQVLLRIAVGPNFDQPIEYTGRSIINEAERLVASLNLATERRVVLLLLPHSPELFLMHIGLVLSGHVPAILAWPTSRIDPEKYQRNLVHQLSNLPASDLVTLPRLADNLGKSLPYSVIGVPVHNGATYEALFPAGKVTERLGAPNTATSNTRPSEDMLFLQFSGGTTGAQKAIVVTAPMLVKQLELLRDTLDFSSNDGVVSWLPMYHDMGLIACLWLPLWHGAPSLQIGANDWILNPELLLRYITRYSSTFCWLPNFSFSYLAQRREQMKGDYRLGSIRGWINCSEPVRQTSMHKFADAFATWGVEKSSLQCCYAMAETVFAISQSTLGGVPLSVPRNQVHRGNGTYSQLAFDMIDDVYVSSGRPIPETKIKIVNGDGTECGELEPGEIHVNMPCLFSGYWGSEGFKTFSLNNGWHATGDFGFMSGGELFVIGRLKDIVIIGGQNVFPEDVEAIVNTVDGISAGRVVAFGIEDEEYGTQALGIVAESKADLDEDASFDMETTIRKLVLAAIGIAPRYVAVVPQRWIVKSTAGKISRKETRERFIRERINVAQAQGAI
jgi:fatty-acyl-CoA synthase